VGRAKYWGDIVAKLVIGRWCDAQFINCFQVGFGKTQGWMLINVAAFFNSGGFCPEVKCTVLNEISTSMGNPGTVEDLYGSAAHFYKILSSFAAACYQPCFTGNHA